jgi:membrane protein DedA with SNARE-associated domain
MHGAALVWLALSTLVSEDLASIRAGLLAREGHLPLGHAIVTCAIGVYLGDLALWSAGRLFQRRVLALRWLSGRLDPTSLETLGLRLDARLPAAVMVSRFVPGSRLPMYVAAGIWGRRPLAFAVWSLVAVIAWTPLLVVSSAVFGGAVIAPVLQGIETGVLGLVVAGGVMWGLVRLGGRFVGVTLRRYHHLFDQTIETPT